MKRKFKAITVYHPKEINETIERELENGYEPISIGASDGFLCDRFIHILFKLIK